MEKLETSNYRFHNSISTDGVAVSLLMLRPKKAEVVEHVVPKKRAKKASKPEPPKMSPEVEAISEKYRQNKYKKLIGLDFGHRLLYGYFNC